MWGYNPKLKLFGPHGGGSKLGASLRWHRGNCRGPNVGQCGPCLTPISGLGAAAHKPFAEWPCAAPRMPHLTWDN